MPIRANHGHHADSASTNLAAGKDRHSNIVVAVITFQRPDSLRALLDSLHTVKTDANWRIVVVDNDPSGSARPIVSEVAPHAHYVVEPRAGIAAARNRCLDLMAETDDAIVFVDDDEVVSPNWLQDLIDTAHQFNADIVAGPVVSLLPEGAPRWITRDGFIQRRIRRTGDRTGLPATNNVLVSAAVLRRTGPIRFDNAFSFTGGSDTDFFSRLVSKGASLVWSADAIVYEHVQAERLSLRWLARRYTRGGEVWARIARRDKPAVWLLLQGLFYCATAIVAAPVTLTLLRGRRGQNFILFFRGRGIIRSVLLRRSYYEYARDSE